MEQKEPAKPNLPSEAIELYNLFIHGVISRRAFFTVRAGSWRRAIDLDELLP